MESTPIRISNDIIQMLKELKTHPRETYDDIIQRLVKFAQSEIVEYHKFEKAMLKEILEAEKQ